MIDEWTICSPVLRTFIIKCEPHSCPWPSAWLPGTPWSTGQSQFLKARAWHCLPAREARQFFCSGVKCYHICCYLSIPPLFLIESGLWAYLPPSLFCLPAASLFSLGNYFLCPPKTHINMWILIYKEVYLKLIFLESFDFFPPLCSYLIYWMPLSYTVFFLLVFKTE